MIQALGDCVIIKTKNPDKMTKHGILIPSMANERPMEGTVVAAGPGYEDKPMTVKVGDDVLYIRYSNKDVVIHGEKYIAIRCDCILAIV